MAYTIKDVSRLAGVSTATVSRAFSNPESVSEKARQSVAEAARILNYQPNAIARSMARQQTEKIAFLICKKQSSILDEFYAGICNGIMKATNQSEYQLLISTEEDWGIGKRNQVDGMILGGNASISLVSQCMNQGIRTVLVNNEIEGFSLPCVISDEEAGVRMVLEHLISRGHRRIGMLAGRFSPYISKRRYQGFQTIAKEYSLVTRPGWIRTTDPDIDSATEEAAAILRQDERPTAIFGTNDEIATGIMKAAARLGLRVPEDVAVIGYDDSRVCRAMEPELTSVHIFRTRMGEEAAGLLLKLLQGEEPEETRIMVKPELIVRGSA